jgi:hypothetical protein
MLTNEDHEFLRQAKQQANSEWEFVMILRSYVEEEEGDCLLCKNLLLKELLEAAN